LTGRKREFATSRDVGAAGFNRDRVYRAIQKGGKYRGMIWGWKAALDPFDARFGRRPERADDHNSDTDLEDSTQLEPVALS